MRHGDATRLVTACASCHGLHGEGRGTTPAIAGQTTDYFIRTMRLYHQGERHNDVYNGMRQFSQRLSPAEATLIARYYYIYAIDYDRGGEWSGQAFMCSRDKEFTIRGADNCLARGFDRTGFFEVDTGEQRAWTVQLTDSNEQQPAQRVPGIPGTIGPNGAGSIPGISGSPGGIAPGTGLPPTPAPGTKP